MGKPVPLSCRPFRSTRLLETSRNYCALMAWAISGAVDELLALTGGHPQRTVLLAHHLYNSLDSNDETNEPMFTQHRVSPKYPRDFMIVGRSSPLTCTTGGASVTGRATTARSA